MLDHVFAKRTTTARAIAETGVEQIRNPDDIAKAVTQVLADNPAAIADFGAGRERALHALIGLVMRATGGKAAPDLTRALLLERLQSP